MGEEPSGGLTPARAEAVVEEVAQAARAILGSRLISVYAIGSLAHGGFAPLTSDIDVAFVLADGAVMESADAARLRAAAAQRVGDDAVARVSIFWSDWSSLRSGAGRGRFPAVDRLDLAEHGRWRLGPDRRAEIAVPTARALTLETARFALSRLASPSTLALLRDPDHGPALGVVEITKTVLFPVRFMYTIETGRAGGAADAVAWYLGAHPTRPGAALAADALRWRERGLPAEPRGARELAELGALIETACRALAGAARELRVPTLTLGLRVTALAARPGSSPAAQVGWGLLARALRAAVARLPQSGA